MQGKLVKTPKNLAPGQELKRDVREKSTASEPLRRCDAVWRGEARSWYKRYYKSEPREAKTLNYN